MPRPDVFVEGGTYKGNTARTMSEIFKNVYTIEKSNEMFNIANNDLSNISNIVMLKGDTREYLSTILENNNNILFRLNAHWCRELTNGVKDKCPLIEELNTIFSLKKNFVILIDDARLFLAPLPKSHNFIQWSSITDIVSIIPTNWELIEYEEVIYLFPKLINNKFKTYLQ